MSRNDLITHLYIIMWKACISIQLNIMLCNPITAIAYITIRDVTLEVDSVMASLSVIRCRSVYFCV